MSFSRYPRRLGALLLLACVTAVISGPAPAAEASADKVALLAEALRARDDGDLVLARVKLQAVLAIDPRDRSAQELLAGLDQAPTKAVQVSGGTVNPTLSPEEVAALVRRGRSQFLAGEPTAAAQTFTRVLDVDPGHVEARDFLRRIAASGVDANTARTQTSAQMLNEVQRAWQRAEAVPERAAGPGAAAAASPLLAKLDAIVLPSVSFSGMELGRVVNTLSVISEEFDGAEAKPRGVNIVLVDPANGNPPVSLTLRNLSLRRVLDFITESVGYQYEVQADAVVVRPGGEQSALDTAFFPVSRATVLRMTGKPTAPAGAGPAAPATGSEAEGQGIRSFLQLAGVSFEAVPGSTLAFDGSQLIVTQTPRNLERIRNILRRYIEVRQVEIEAKFMEVQAGALEELGVNWGLTTKETQRNAAQATYLTGNRSLNEAFRNSTTSQEIKITGQDPIDVSAPIIPGGVNLGAGAAPLATVQGILGEFNVEAVVRALSQKSGTELLSAPKLTVLSGNPATITVAQELRYPQSYGQVQSQVGTGSASGGGSAGVTVTAGTPQEFTTRNVGVELRVTPTVEEDDNSISLDLNPRVTEFEGFVEYGGQSVAISSGTTVTVPSGFYQPIFAVRELTTRVTLWDGATLIMGGLTREDVRKTNDKVPVIGNVPVLGRLFRSDGESAQKRNLLIFVTANLVNPGGALKNQAVRGAGANSLYQNPTVVTPAGTGQKGAPRK